MNREVVAVNTVAGEYFCEVARTVFDDYFQELGAVREPSDSLTCVRYSTDEWFVGILYLPSDGPNYVPRLEIGCQNGQFADPRRNRIDIMHTAPEGSEEHEYNLRWRYRSAEQLATVLRDVRDRILAVSAVPFLRDTNRLQALLKERHDVVEAEWKKQINNHNDSIHRQAAEAAFTSKDYEKAITCYGEISEERQSKIDKSKLRIAESRAL